MTTSPINILEGSLEEPGQFIDRLDIPEKGPHGIVIRGVTDQDIPLSIWFYRAISFQRPWRVVWPWRLFIGLILAVVVFIPFAIFAPGVLHYQAREVR